MLKRFEDAPIPIEPGDRDRAERPQFLPFGRAGFEVGTICGDVDQAERAISAIDAPADGSADVAEAGPRESHPREGPLEEGYAIRFVHGATTTEAAPAFRAARTAASIVEPVARPSSTRTAVRPLRSSGGKPAR